jgi:hypothetical protein
MNTFGRKKKVNPKGAAVLNELPVVLTIALAALVVRAQNPLDHALKN